MNSRVYIGTSGWNYDTWKNDFYAGVKKKDWLRFCAEHFTAIEINATFYRLQKPGIFVRWREETPTDFRFAIKGNRYVTHNKKLADPVPSIKLERDRAKALGDKLAAVIWQLPPRFQYRLDRLEGFAAALVRWDDTRHAIEFRHRSWFNEAVAELLQRHRIGVCQSDAADWPLWDALTTDLVYIRLHGHTRTYASAYSTPSLKRWAMRIRDWRKQGHAVHTYFDNDSEGAAPVDAMRLLQFLSLSARKQNTAMLE